MAGRVHELEEKGAGRVDTWPCWLRNNLLSTGTLDVRARFATTLCLLGNGVLPSAIAAYLAGSGLLADRRAHSHIWGIMRDFRDGNLRDDIQFYDMQHRCSMRVYCRESVWAHGAPPEMRGREIWGPARDYLVG